MLVESIILFNWFFDESKVQLQTPNHWTVVHIIQYINSTVQIVCLSVLEASLTHLQEVMVVVHHEKNQKISLPFG